MKRLSNKQAIERVIRENFTFVRQMALSIKSRFRGALEIDEMVNAGCMGLVQAYERFDVSLGHKFQTFAAPRVRGAIVDEMRRQDWVSRDLRQKMKKLNKINDVHLVKEGRRATDRELSEEMHLKSEDCSRLQAHLAQIEEIRREGIDFLDRRQDSPFDLVCQHNQQEVLKKCLDRLTPREAEVLRLQYFGGYNHKEISEKLGISEPRVTQLQNAGLQKLRSILRSPAKAA